MSSTDNASPKKPASKNKFQRTKRIALFRRNNFYETDNDRTSHQSRTSTRASARLPSRSRSPPQFEMELEEPSNRRSRSKSQQSRGRNQSRDTSRSRKKSRSPRQDPSKERRKERDSERLAREREYSLKRTFDLEHNLDDPVDTDQSLYDDDLQFRMDDIGDGSRRRHASGGRRVERESKRKARERSPAMISRHASDELQFEMEDM